MAAEPSPTSRSVLESRLGYLLKHTQARFVEEHTQALLPLGINGRELTFLAVFAAESPLSQLEAAGRLGVDRTTMVAIVDDLEAKGLVERRRSEQDRRKNVIELTEAGRECLKLGEQARKEAEDRFLAPLGETDGAALLRILQTLHNEAHAELR